MEKTISFKYAEAIKAINNIGAVVSGNTKEEIEINWLNQNPISIETIENKIIELEQAEEQAKQAKIDTKASALAKLSALGLTEEEVQAIIK